MPNEPEPITLVCAGGRVEMTATITLAPLSADELRVRELSKRATQERKTDINTAISTLIAAQKIARDQGMHQVIDWWLRLPIFYAAAGDIQSAMLEFARIKKQVMADVHRQFAHLPEKIRAGSALPRYAKIFESIALVFKRSNQLKKSAKARLISERYMNRHLKHRVLVDMYFDEQSRSVAERRALRQRDKDFSQP